MKEESLFLPSGTLLQGGKYRIKCYLSSGGFGCTYEAVHVKSKKRVAIKEFFAKDICNRDEATFRVSVGVTNKLKTFNKLRDKFLVEARVLQEFSHPGIVHVSDVFEENGTAYYVMDYIDGGSLEDFVKRGRPLPEARAVSYVLQVCNALQYVHSHNRLHLDIKPANVMVDSAGHVILIDFGVSKQYDEYDGENKSTLLGSTPGYAPVEQIGNDVVQFLPATDIYALGATLYKLLTGVTPPAANRLASGNELPPLPKNVSEATRNAVREAMRIKKDERPQSVEEFLALLEGRDASEPEVTVIKEPDKKLHPKPETKPKPEPVKPKPALDDKSHIARYVAIVACAVGAIIGILVLMNRGTSTSAPSGSPNQGTAFVSPSPQPVPSSSKPTSASSGSAPGTTSGKTNNNTVTTASGTINGHSYVDLGLSVKWATYNVGASSPSDYGNYYAWGEVSTKSEYTEANSKTYGKSYGDIGGNSSTDAARANWGGSWRLPTKSECEELKNNCTWTWTTMNGKNGYKVTGRNGNSIFLPAAGCRDGSSLYDAGSYGSYWGSTPYESNTYGAFYLYFDSGLHYVVWYDRYFGFSVRPVSE